MPQFKEYRDYLNQEEKDQMQALKDHFPFRVIWGALEPDTGEFRCGASYTRRNVNAYVRKGWKGFVI